jgi:hypothetical protein
MMRSAAFSYGSGSGSNFDAVFALFVILLIMSESVPYRMQIWIRNPYLFRYLTHSTAFFFLNCRKMDDGKAREIVCPSAGVHIG